MAVDQQELRELDRAIGDLALLTGRTVGSVIVSTILDAGRSASVETKPNVGRSAGSVRPKNRKRNSIRGKAKARANKTFLDGRSGDYPWWADYEVLLWAGKSGPQRKPRSLFVTKSRLHQFAKIPHRGVAKRAWLGAVSRIRRQPKAIPFAARRFSWGKVRKQNNAVVSALLVNSVNYLGAAGRDSDRKGLRAAGRKLTGFHLPKAEERIARSWKRGIRSIGRAII